MILDDLLKANILNEAPSQSSVKWNERRIEKNLQKFKDHICHVKRKQNKLVRPPKESKEFRENVIANAEGRCVVCDSSIRLEAHHLNSYKFNPNTRFDSTNGVALCYECHRLFHKQYGTYNNVEEQFNEFYSNYR